MIKGKKTKSVKKAAKPAKRRCSGCDKLVRHNVRTCPGK